ncbi:MAG TPA: DUF1330 domain-containing protein [Pseudolabrys sp.]|nr:DUF1330 domain-containing protein [Pseudolabrys sp.]
MLSVNRSPVCRSRRQVRVIEGKGRTRIVVIEFKNFATALECYRSSEYA